MFSKRKKRIGVFTIIVMASLCFALGFSWEKAHAVQKISLATGGASGSWYPTGGLLAELCNNKIPEINITAEVTSGSGENAKLMDAKKVELCYLNGLAAYWAWNGVKPMFDHKIANLRSLFYVHGGTGHIVVLKKSNIKTWKDLKGKRIATGSPTGNQEIYTRACFKAYGFSDEEIKKMERKWVFMSFTEMIRSLKDGRIDAGQVYAGMPNAGVMDISTTHGIDLIGLTEDIQKKLVKEYPFFSPEIVPANMYKGVTKDVRVVASSSLVFADKDFSADMVYKIVKTVHDNLDQLARGHKAFERWKFDPAAGNLIPLHEGAKRYYKEKGLLK